jgi:hypothetical protein
LSSLVYWNRWEWNEIELQGLALTSTHTVFEVAKVNSHCLEFGVEFSQRLRTDCDDRVGRNIRLHMRIVAQRRRVAENLGDSLRVGEVHVNTRSFDI